MARRDGVCHPLTISFLFHFNQNIGPYTKIAVLACYQGLLLVLRKHKNKKFNIHISGTLIESLKRFAPATLKEFVRGVKDGQFELLGSTYAQNVPAATDELSNRYQMEQHLEIIYKTFGVRPRGFWISERCWEQHFVKLLADFGYSYTLVEKQTLEKVKLKNYYLPYKTTYQNRSIAIVQDDEHFKHKVNFAIWCNPLPSPPRVILAKSRIQSGNPNTFQPALAHLESVGAHKDATKSIVVYAEDAEASGLWGVHFGAYPQPVWKNWDRFLNCLEKDSRFQISAIGDFLQRSKRKKEIGPIPDGQAEWMVQSLRKKGAPYHEDGYSDWFDFNRRSQKIKKYRKLFSELAKEIQKAEKECIHLSSCGSPPLKGWVDAKQHGVHEANGKNRRELRNIRKLKLHVQQAKLILCRSQYEFGCIGIGKEKYAPFEKARECLIPLSNFWKILNKNYHITIPSPFRGRGWSVARVRGTRSIRVNQRGLRNPRESAFMDSEWKKFKKLVPAKKAWFQKFIADWIFDLAPQKVVQYLRPHPLSLKGRGWGES